MKTLGSQLQKITNSPEIKGLNTAKSPPISSNLSDIGPGQSPQNPSRSTGRELTETTLKPGLLQSFRADLALCEQPQQAVEYAKALLPQEIQSSLKPDYGPTGMLKRYRLMRPAGPNAMAQAREVLAQLLTPMSGEMCLDLLTELKALTRPTPGTTQDMEMQFVVYLKRLMDYPADVVRYVLKTQAQQSPWWPAWSELLERLELHTYRRRMMLAALASTTSPT